MKTMTKAEAKHLSPTTLAFYGDCVYEELVRRKIVRGGSRPSNALHKASVEMVRASFQAMAYDLLLPILTEEETDILKRGRNAIRHIPKNGDRLSYETASGLEAVTGYLYLMESERLDEMFKLIFEEMGNE